MKPRDSHNSSKPTKKGSLGRETGSGDDKMTSIISYSVGRGRTLLVFVIMDIYHTSRTKTTAAVTLQRLLPSAKVAFLYQEKYFPV